MHKKFTWLMIFAGILLILGGLLIGRDLLKEFENANGVYSLNKISVTVRHQEQEHATAAFTPDEVNKLADKMADDREITFLAQAFTEVSTDKNRVNTPVFGTNHSYSSFHDLNLVDGSFFTRAEEEHGEPVAVIDAALAYELFGSENVLGTAVEIYGKKFGIVGIFKTPEKLLFKWSGSGYCGMYIPVEALTALNPDAGITSLEQSTSATDNSVKVRSDLNNYLTAMGKDSENYVITDYNAERKKLEQDSEFAIFAMGITVIYFLLRFAFNCLKNMYRSFADSYRKHYFVNALLFSAKMLFVRIAVTAACLLFACLIWRFISFEFYPVQPYIPEQAEPLLRFTSKVKLWTDIVIPLAGLLLVNIGLFRLKILRIKNSNVEERT